MHMEERKNSTGRQAILFFVLSLIGSVVEIAVFAAGNFFLFKGLSDRPFQWFLFSYSVAEGGLCTFVARAVSFACAQTTNFLIHRKVTFKSSSNVAFSAVMYAVMVILCYIYVLWLPSVLTTTFVGLFGKAVGPVAVVIFSQFTSALIQFPINKFLIMR